MYKLKNQATKVQRKPHPVRVGSLVVHEWCAQDKELLGDQWEEDNLGNQVDMVQRLLEGRG